MRASPTAALSRGLVALALAVGLLAGTTAADAAPSGRIPANTSGTASGSAANGVGNLKTSLATLSGGRLQITWVPWTRNRNIRKWVVRVGPNRSLDSQVKTYTVRAATRGVVVPQAFGVTPYSGNFSFVKVQMVLRTKRVSASPTKWIKAPIAAACTASVAHRVTVGTFNVRQWGLDSSGNPGFRWTVRGPRVVREILASGARVIALQEASGMGNVGYGSDRQWTWILRHLNAADPTADWVDAVGDAAYSGGLVGTRVIYDANRYDKLSSGLYDLADLGVPGSSVLPWARLQARDGSQPAFTFAGTHLLVGESRTAFDIRGQQIGKVIALLQAKAAANPTEQVMLAGDMNSTVNTRPYNNVQYLLLRAGFYDAFASAATANSRFGTTNSYQFPVRATPYRRDYLMTLGPAKGSCAYVNRAYISADQAASDHFMQVASLPLSAS